MIDIQLFVNKLKNELLPIMPDIEISTAYYGPLSEAQCSPHFNATGQIYYSYGVRAYAGMVEGKISVHWSRFFDRIAGNGWMFGRDRLFKFDMKDGDCKYNETPLFLPDCIDQFINEMKKEHANGGYKFEDILHKPA